MTAITCVPNKRLRMSELLHHIFISSRFKVLILFLKVFFTFLAHHMLSLLEIPWLRSKKCLNT